MTPEERSALIRALMKCANLEHANLYFGQVGSVTNHYPGTNPPAKDQEHGITVIQPEEDRASPEVSDDDRMKYALKEAQKEPDFKLYDWTWVRVVLGDQLDIRFESTPKFIEFLKDFGIKELPKPQAINNFFGVATRIDKEYIFTDIKDRKETIRRNNIMKRFISAYRNLS